MSSRSSNSAAERLIPIGRVKGHRGTRGELTVLLEGGDASAWVGLPRVWLAAGAAKPEPWDVETSRAYRDRLVLRLRGIEDGNAAEGLRGRRLMVRLDEAPPLPEDSWYRGQLEGFEVLDTAGRTLGRVRWIEPTGGTDLLVIERAAGGEDLLVPLARDIVDIDADAATVRVRPPEGLLELNQDHDR